MLKHLQEKIEYIVKSNPNKVISLVYMSQVTMDNKTLISYSLSQVVANDAIEYDKVTSRKFGIGLIKIKD